MGLTLHGLCLATIELGTGWCRRWIRAYLGVGMCWTWACQGIGWNSLGLGWSWAGLGKDGHDLEGMARSRNTLPMFWAWAGLGMG